MASLRLIACALALAACYDVPRPECGFQCGPADECPDGYSCLGNRCRLDSDRQFSCPEIEDPSIADTTPPAVMARAPSPGEIDVALDTHILVTFDEEVTGVDETTFGLANDSLFTMGVVTVASPLRAFRFSPDRPLEVNSVYEVVLGTAIRDLAGNRLAETRWTFATIEDRTGPVLIASMPVDGATNASPFGITLNFDEPVAGISSSSVRVEKAGVPVPTTFTMPFPSIVSVSPVDPLESETLYTIVLTSGITDVPGNPFIPRTLSFTTRDTIPPSITTRAPLPDATGVPIDTTIAVTFSEGVDVDGFSVRLFAGATLVPTTFVYDGISTLTLTPTALLDPSTVYTVSFMTIHDLAGNPATFPSYTFTTAP